MTSDSDFYSFTPATLARGGKDLEAVEEWWGSELDRLDAGETYDDVLDRLDGSPWEVDGQWLRVDLPGQLTDPVYRRLVAIGRRVRRESA